MEASLYHTCSTILERMLLCTLDLTWLFEEISSCVKRLNMAAGSCCSSYCVSIALKAGLVLLEKRPFSSKCDKVTRHHLLFVKLELLYAISGLLL
jgi:hypothetical protein